MVSLKGDLKIFEVWLNRGYKEIFSDYFIVELNKVLDLKVVIEVNKSDLLLFEMIDLDLDSMKIYEEKVRDEIMN